MTISRPASVPPLLATSRGASRTHAAMSVAAGGARQLNRRECHDRALLAVLEHGEIIRGQPAHRMAILVEHSTPRHGRCRQSIERREAGRSVAAPAAMRRLPTPARRRRGYVATDVTIWPSWWPRSIQRPPLLRRLRTGTAASRGRILACVAFLSPRPFWPSPHQKRFLRESAWLPPTIRSGIPR